MRTNYCYYSIFIGILFLIGIIVMKTSATPPKPQLPTRSSFGEVCTQTMRCDSRGWLSCNDGLCGCIKQEEMIYEEKVRKCVSKSGERCSFVLDNVEGNNSISERTRCVSSARCNAEGICECRSNFYENSNGTCTPTHDHGESCSSGTQCSIYQGLFCQEGTCQCDRTKSVYNDNLALRDGGSTIWGGGQCVGLAGFPCINSFCTQFSSCFGSKCVCDDLHYPDASGLCLPRLERLHKCTEDFQCNQTLVCLNGFCDCDPSVSIYGNAYASIKYSDKDRNNYWAWSSNKDFHGFNNESRTQCIGKSGSPCIDGRCTTRAFCSYPTEPQAFDQRGICKCQSEYTESKVHKCGTKYGTRCSSSSTCIDGLVCRNSECLCPFKTQTFDELTKTCLSQIGGPCKTDESCEARAKCTFSSTKRKSTGHCECRNGYVENLQGNCKTGFGTTCSSDSECDPIAELQCIDQKCECPVFAEYNSKLRKCVGLVGAKCDLGKVAESECTPNALCSEGTSPQLPGSCTCNPGYEEYEDYTCVPEGWNDN